MIPVLVGAWMGAVAVFLGALAFGHTDDAWQIGGYRLVVASIIGAAFGGAVGALSEGQGRNSH